MKLSLTSILLYTLLSLNFTYADEAGTIVELGAEATILANPDIAIISAAVITEDASLSKARSENAKQMNAAFAALKALKVADKDIQTTSIRITPQYTYIENKPPKINSYQASNTLNIKIRNLDQLGSAIDKLLEAGINQVNGPDFSIEDTNKLKDQARVEAIKKVKALAELYATTTELKVSRIISMREQSAGQNPMQYPEMQSIRMAKMDDAPTQIANGQISVGVTVYASFLLK